MSSSKWISANSHKPLDGEEVWAVVSGQHGGLRYDHEVVRAIWDEGSWYLDDGVVDDEQTIIVSEWMPLPQPTLRSYPQQIDAKELMNRLILISATAGQWSGPHVIQEVIQEVRRMTD